jgi:Domain of unknown function (DUF4349)
MSRRTAVAASSVAFLVVAGLVGAACSGGRGGGASTVPQASVRAPRDAFAGPDTAIGGGGVVAAPVPVPAAEAGGGTGLDVALPAIGPKIIKDATLSLEVKKGSFDERVQEATQIAGRHGGFVASSQAFEGRRRSGTIVLRVPADQFEAALGELKGLGKVRGQRVSGQDVTAQFVDLQARLRNFETQETVLLNLLSKSKSIDDSIKVQRALQDVQLAIEEIRGQLRVLDDQTDFSTISVSITEIGPVAQPPGKKPSLVRAWHDALDGFVAVIAAVVIGIGYLLPIVLIGLALFVGWWGYRRYRTRTAGPVPSA